MKDKEELQEELQEEQDITQEELELFGNIHPGELREKEEEQEQDAETEDAPADEESPDETTEEPETETADDKTAGWTLEDYQKGYSNLEKALGKQGQELGELRKALTEVKPEAKEYSINDIPEMDDTTLNRFIDTYEETLSDPSLEFDDPERHEVIVKEYGALKEERSVRKALERINREKTKEVISTVADSISKKYKLSETEVDKVTALATRLSEDGVPTKEDFEAAVYRLDQRRVADVYSKEVEQRIKQARTKETPRISSGSGRDVAPAQVTVEKFTKMSEYEQSRYLAFCSQEEVDRLLGEINE